MKITKTEARYVQEFKDLKEQGEDTTQVKEIIKALRQHEKELMEINK